MKKKILIISIIVLLFLIIPVPSGVYKDGGTRTYTSLTYKIVDWNHLYGSGHYDKTKIYPFPMNFMSLDSLLSREKKYFEYVEENQGKENTVIENIDFSAQYIRTDGYIDGADYPVVTLIKSRNELFDYYNKNKDKYSLGDFSVDDKLSFVGPWERYDEQYFENNMLVLVLLEEGSGSIRHSVNSVYKVIEGETTRAIVDIQRKVPEACTDDMAEWHIFVEIPKLEKITSENIQVFIDGIDENKQPKTIRHSKGYANVTFDLPDGWEYEIIDSEESKEFEINLSRLDNIGNAVLSIKYYNYMFGYCGTDLTQEAVRVGKHIGVKSTYGNKDSWDFIMLKDTPGDYVIWNYSVENGFSKYKEDIDVIISSIVVGEGSITESQAIDIAKESVEKEYDNVRASFDCNTGIYTIEFYKYNPDANETKTIILTNEGKPILD